MATTTLTSSQRREQDRRVALKRGQTQRLGVCVYFTLLPAVCRLRAFSTALRPVAEPAQVGWHLANDVDRGGQLHQVDDRRHLVEGDLQHVWLFVGATIPQLIIALRWLLSSALPIQRQSFFRAAFFAPNRRRGGGGQLIFTSLLGTRYGNAELCARLDRHCPG